MADDDYDDQTDLVPRAQIRQLEEKAKRAAELEQRLATVERDAAFAKALGTAATDPKMKYFVAAYDGELTPEAIRNEAVSAGFLGVKEPDATDQISQQHSNDLAAHDRMTQAAAGADGPGQTTWQQALADADRIQNQAEREAAILDVVERFGGVTSRTAQ